MRVLRWLHELLFAFSFDIFSQNCKNPHHGYLFSGALLLHPPLMWLLVSLLPPRSYLQHFVANCCLLVYICFLLALILFDVIVVECGRSLVCRHVLEHEASLVLVPEPIGLLARATRALWQNAVGVHGVVRVGAALVCLAALLAALLTAALPALLTALLATGYVGINDYRVRSTRREL